MEFLSLTRFETPPYVRRPAPVYDMTPFPRNILKSALKTAERLGLWGPAESRRFYRWAYAAVGIIDYRVRFVTTSPGGGWRARGFVGWAAYRAFETSMLGGGCGAPSRPRRTSAWARTAHWASAP